MSFTCAPAPSSAFLGSISSACSFKSLAIMATRSPCKLCSDIVPPNHVLEVVGACGWDALRSFEAVSAGTRAERKRELLLCGRMQHQLCAFSLSGAQVCDREMMPHFREYRLIGVPLERRHLLRVFKHGDRGGV